MYPSRSPPPRQVEQKFRDLLLEDVGQAALYSTEQLKARASEAEESRGVGLVMFQLLRGNKEEAVQLAIQHNLWPLALLVSSRVSKAAYLGP